MEAVGREELQGMMKDMDDPEMMALWQEHDEDIAKALAAEEFKNEKKIINKEFKKLLKEKIGNIKNIDDLNKLIDCLKKCIEGKKKRQTRKKKKTRRKPKAKKWAYSSDESSDYGSKRSSASALPRRRTRQVPRVPSFNNMMMREQSPSSHSPSQSSMKSNSSLKSPSSRSPSLSSMERSSMKSNSSLEALSSAAGPVNEANENWRKKGRFLVSGKKTPDEDEVGRMRERAYLEYPPTSTSPYSSPSDVDVKEFKPKSRFIPVSPQPSREVEEEKKYSGSNFSSSSDGSLDEMYEFRKKPDGEGMKKKKKTKKAKKKKAGKKTKKAGKKKGKNKQAKNKTKKGGKRKKTKKKTKKKTLAQWLKERKNIFEKGPPRGIISNAWVRKTCPCRNGDDCIPCPHHLKKYKDGRKKTKKKIWPF